MTFSLRRIAGSRRLQAMAVLGWLMFVVQFAAAASFGMSPGPHAGTVHASTVATVVPGAHCHHGASAPTHDPCCNPATGCCSGALGQCACAAMCATVLPPAVLNLALASLTATYGISPRVTAPSLAVAPPLRPPSI